MTPLPETPRPRWYLLVWTVPAVWIGFVIVHIALALIANRYGPYYFGDVHLYGWWTMRGLYAGHWPVITDVSVYPVGALLPMVTPALLAPQWSGEYDAYRVAYQAMVCLLDGIALAALLRAGRRAALTDDSRALDHGSRARPARTIGAWWWLVFLVCLGPISLTRLDGVAAALTVIALCTLVGPTDPRGLRPRLAAALATLGAWIKIAPGATWLAMAATSRRPWRDVAVPGLIATGALVLPTGVAILALDGPSGLARLGSFLGEQDGRGLQSESVGATVFSVARLFGSGHVIELNKEIATWEIYGPGTTGMSKVVAVLLVVSVMTATAFTWLAARRVRAADLDTSTAGAALLELTLFAATTLTFLLFVFNKVGSPQFIAWLAPPVAVALTALPARRRWRTSSRLWVVLALALPLIGLATQRLYPIGYGGFIRGDTLDVLVGALRNAATLLLALWLIAVLARWRAPHPPGPPAAEPRDTPAAVDTVAP